MEIIPKEPSKPSKILNILLYFSLILLFFSIISFFILDHFVGKFKKEYILLVQDLEEKEDKIYFLRKELLPYQRKINDFSFVTEQHLESSRFFTAFEKIIHPQVWFFKFNLKMKEKRVILSGQAQNFEVLGQQLYVFRNKEWIEDVGLEAVSMGKKGKIDFNLFLILDPELFNN